VKVTTYRTVAHGKTTWVLAWTEAGKRRRKHYRTQKKAEAARGEKVAQIESAGYAWINLSPKERNECMELYLSLKKENVTMQQALYLVRASRQTLPTKSLGRAVVECLKDKKQRGVRPRYLETLRDILRRFIKGRSKVPVARITFRECEEWIDLPSKHGGKPAAETRRGRQSKLATFFSWCQQRRLVAENPIDRLGRIAVEQRPPIILTPDQVDKALRWVKAWKDFRPYLVLGLFCGIRPDELQRLSWDNVDLQRGLVTVDAATSKVRRRRIVPIAERARVMLTAVQRLKSAGRVMTSAVQRASTLQSGPIWAGKKTTLRRRKRQLAKALGFAHWPADLLRHTAASYLMARDKDAGKVADMLGNSAGVLLTRYRELVSPEASALFWGA
jgi:integrase